jgi:hypothetical protein
LEIVGVATEIKQDGKLDRIVAFASNVCGVKERTGVQADIEFVEADWRKWRQRWA